VTELAIGRRQRGRLEEEDQGSALDPQRGRRPL
jgi:hypothetical protein